ncbi:N-6 DNA methylase [Halobacteriovorax sp. RZ-1]|uniref:Eco57I restriction-modification methylase domain-containing protein n=1 Tax=unclassified Halobacteriovorax TaxID=2639665 RepID=UPI0037133D96
MQHNKIKSIAKLFNRLIDNLSNNIKEEDYFLAPLAIVSSFQIANALPNKDSRSDSLITHIEMLFPTLKDSLVRFEKALKNSSENDLYNEISSELEIYFENREYDPYVLSWFYQYLKTSIEERATSMSFQGRKIEGDDLKFTTQFFTDKYMVKYLVKEALSQYKTKESLTQLLIVDPACGGGNFLIESLIHLSSTFHSKAIVKSIILENILAYDIDENMALLTKINLWILSCHLSSEIVDYLPKSYAPSKKSLTGFLDLSENDFLLKQLSSARKKVFLTNPPFMGKRMMCPNLKSFLQRNYPLSKGDLCSSFIEACLNTLNDNDSLAMVHQTSWMFLSSFKDLRKVILENYSFHSVVDLGSNAFRDLNGEKTRVALTIINGAKPTSKGTPFYRLVNLPLEEKVKVLNKKKLLNKYSSNVRTSSFLKNSLFEFNYNLSNEFREIFNESPSYAQFATPMQGTSTGDNKNFIKYHWEKGCNDEDWVSVSKGGGYAKWNGLNQYLVKWGENACHISNNKGSALRNLKMLDSTDLVFSDTGSQGLNVRLFNQHKVFIASGPGISVKSGSKYAHMAFLNSKLASFFIKTLSPKLTISAGYIARLPFNETLANSVELSQKAKKCSNLKAKILQGKVTNSNYTYKKIVSVPYSEKQIFKIITSELKLELQKLKLESEIEDFIHTSFNLSKESSQHVFKEVGLPCYLIEDNESKDLNIEKVDALISKSLNFRCELKRNGLKSTQSVSEGILEYLSFNLQIHPERTFQFINENISKLEKTLVLFAKDQLHKQILNDLRFNAHRTWNSNTISLDKTAETYDKFQSTIKKPVKEWIIEELPHIHNESFFNKPILKIKNNEIKIGRGLQL